MTGRQKRRRTDSLPLLDDVFQQSSSTKSRVMESFASPQVDFQRDTFVDLKDVPESAKVCWIFARFSVKAVMNVADQCDRVRKNRAYARKNVFRVFDAYV